MGRDVWAWGIGGAVAVLFVLGLNWIEAIMDFEQKCSVCGRNLDGLESLGSSLSGKAGCRFCSWGIFPLHLRDL